MGKVRTEMRKRHIWDEKAGTEMIQMHVRKA
jgi:hypothetical protein